MSGIAEAERALVRPRFRWRRAGLRLLASALLVGVILSVFGQREIFEHMRRITPSAWFASLLFFLGLHACGAVKWRWFLQLSGVRLSAWNALRFYGAGLFANLCLPSLIGGDVLRAGLAMAEVERKEAVVLGSVADRVADLVALGLIVVLGALFSPAHVDTLSESRISGAMILAVFFGAMALGLGGVWIVLRSRPLRAWPRGVARRLLELARAWRTLRARPARAFAGLGFCFAIQSGFVLVNVLLGSAMGFHMDARLWFLLWPLAKIVAMMPVSLGGFGVRELAFAALVKPFGYPAKLAIAQSFLWQTVLIAGGVLAGLYCVVGARRAPRR